MNVAEFVAKWSKAELTESSASQQHFLDLCSVFDHPTPAEADPTGEWFTFEKGAEKQGGGKGWADVWKRGFFGWEYKGKHKDLAAAYDQLLLYREALENPRLLVVCDMDRFVIHTNFTNTVKQTYEISLKDFDKPENIEILRNVFHDPDKLRPTATRDAITREVAERLAGVAKALRTRGFEPTHVARFLDRIVFCLFAEDVGLLPKKLFSQIAENAQSPKHFAELIGQLFAAMADGGYIFIHPIRHFNGDLFTDSPILELTATEINHVKAAAKLDWSAVDPSIFGTLFQRGLDPDTRAQLGAQYTSREDIETLVEPVVMQPLRREWQEVKQNIQAFLATSGKLASVGRFVTQKAIRKAYLDATREPRGLLRQFHERLGEIKVLDPACGSGNFLYVTLQKLKDLEKEVLVFAQDRLFAVLLPRVDPLQFYGIEINPYAFELAQTTLWIGYLQWIQANGFGVPAEPILKRMDNFHNMDAILDLSDPDNPKEPEWPEADFIVGNPPFLGDKMMRRELGDSYVNDLRALYSARIPGQSDLVCYWFERARTHLEENKVRRIGLLATQGIRGGANREVLKRIKETGDIFFAVSDRNWVLDGANVHVSMVGFDNGAEEVKILNSEVVKVINANLTSMTNVGTSKKLWKSAEVSFIGAAVHGPFDISQADALSILLKPNTNGNPNSDVVRLWANSLTITKSKHNLWMIDFRPDIEHQEAALYEAPFEHLKKIVLPVRSLNRRPSRARLWWILGDPQKKMRHALKPLTRHIVTPRVSKYRLFVWMTYETLATDATVAFARSDDFFFGVLHSRSHEVWSLAQGTQLREKESGFRYTPSTCFETFPFPTPSSEQKTAIAAAAKELDDLRVRWLNPPEWTREEILEFPGSVDGPWARYVSEVDGRGIGTVRYPRLVPRDDKAAELLAKRTQTNLYNERPTWLDLAHRKLDEAAFAAYGWEANLSDDEILTRLLALNQQRATTEVVLGGK